MKAPKILPSGKIIDCFDLQRSEVNAWDIAWSLCHQNRYSGATSAPWDVASHTALVVQVLKHEWPDTDNQTILAALLHDAAEAYWCDFPAPLKRIPELEILRSLEGRLNVAVMMRFGVEGGVEWHRIRQADQWAAGLEMNYFWPGVQGLETPHSTFVFKKPIYATAKNLVDEIFKYCSAEVQSDSTLWVVPETIAPYIAVPTHTPQQPSPVSAAHMMPGAEWEDLTPGLTSGDFLDKGI